MSRRSTVRVLLNDDGAPQWHAKWTKADGSRTPWTPLPPTIRVDDREGAKREAARLAPAIKRASAGRTGAETVREYGTRWQEARAARGSRAPAGTSRASSYTSTR
jgi:hypothetical protein